MFALTIYCILFIYVQKKHCLVFYIIHKIRNLLNGRLASQSFNSADLTVFEEKYWQNMLLCSEFHAKFRLFLHHLKMLYVGTNIISNLISKCFTCSAILLLWYLRSCSFKSWTSWQTWKSNLFFDCILLNIPASI